MNRVIQIATASLLLSATTAFADSLRCDRDQKFCLFENRRLVVGDRVVIVNPDDEAVAFGEVSGMDGGERRIEITKRFAQINKSDRIRRDDDSSVSGGPSMEKTYKPYQSPGRIAMGASLGLTPMNIASDALAYSGEGFGEYLWRRGIILVGRLHAFTVSGTIDQGEQGSVPEDYSAQGAIFYGGAAYKFFAKKPLALRTEADLGFAYTSVSSSAAAYPRSLDRLGSGLGIAARLGADVLYTQSGAWKPMAGVSFEVLNAARATTISAGLIKDIK